MGMGRRKIEMKKIECPKARSVCFSKRRQGLFKKAAELSRLHNLDIAAAAFSPAGKPFEFGNIHSVLDRYIASVTTPSLEQNHRSFVSEIKSQLDMDVSKLTLTEPGQYSRGLDTMRTNLVKCLEAKQPQRIQETGDGYERTVRNSMTIANCGGGEFDCTLEEMEMEMEIMSMMPEDWDDALDFGFEVGSNCDLGLTGEDFEAMMEELIVHDTDVRFGFVP